VGPDQGRTLLRVTRIIAGQARGRTLVVPAGRATRPTSDRVREALFSRLQHEGLLTGTRVLDLYAGSGALGLEAASRGAAHVVLVDSDRAAAQACRRNAATVLSGHRGQKVGTGQTASTVQVQQVAAVALLGTAPDLPYDLVLADPPYPLAEDEVSTFLRLLTENDWLDAQAVVVVERSVRGPEPVWPQELVRFDERRYGETVLWFAEPVLALALA